MASNRALAASGRAVVGYSISAAVLALAILLLGVRTATVSGGSNLWFLAYSLCFALLLAARSGQQSLASLPLGAPSHLRKVFATALALTLVSAAAYGAVALKYAHKFDPPANPDAIGSCWKISGDQQMESVSCDDPAAGFEVQRYEPMWQKCDDYFVPSAKQDKYLCLSPIKP